MYSSSTFNGREHNCQMMLLLSWRLVCVVAVASGLDDLLRSGITQANNVVIVNKESSNALDEETLADCNTIVAVQTIFR